VAAVIVVVAGLSAWLATSGGGGATPDFTITTSQGAVANSDSIIESDPSLAKTIPAKLHFIPFDAVAWQHRRRSALSRGHSSLCVTAGIKLVNLSEWRACGRISA
jgi:hypothetical protein